MTAQMLHNISPERPLIINSYDDAVAVVRMMLVDAGALKAEREEVPQEDTAPWVPRRKAQVILKGKGYLVASEAAFIAFKENMKAAGMAIEQKKVGREIWYSRASINSLPNRS